MAAYRFIHAADIHLDSPLRSLALRDPALADLIGNATRQAFVGIVDLALTESVDALLIAGDLYDGEQTSMKTARFLADQLRRLDEAGIQTFIIRGNHDALSKITQELVLPAGVKLYRGRAEAVTIERTRGDVPITIHGLSFAKPQAPESLLPGYRPPLADAVNIGLMHTSLAGAPGHDVYAPSSLADLQAHGFDYWALGHIHLRAAHAGTATVVMAGMPQGRDINEAGPKSVSLVTVLDDRSIRVEERLTSIAEFRRVAVDASGLSEWPDLVAAIGRALRAARTETRSPHLVARLEIAGATPLAWRMRRDADLLKAEADLAAAGLGDAHVEKLVLGVDNPALTAGEGADPLVELARLVESEVLGSAGYRATLGEWAGQLRGQLPSELRDLLGIDEEAAARLMEALAADGAEDVLARLQADAPAGDAG
ncbi:MAG TPA: DNA repair exonuclease [Kaistia sp.]|nr:DNA repair exonuclease [Kaistia sp.]